MSVLRSSRHGVLTGVFLAVAAAVGASGSPAGQNSPRLDDARQSPLIADNDKR